MTSHIKMVGVGKAFGTFNALNHVDLDISRGEFLTFLGPSGSGKTTLLMILAGFEKPSTGMVTKDGVDITGVSADRRNFGMVFQGYALFPHMTVADNIGFPLRVRGILKRERQARVAGMIDLVGLDGHQSKRPQNLSGGQQQRVALARALVFKPELLLLDEPLSALDKNLREQLQFELKEVHRKTGTTFVFVTHDQNEALALSDRIAIFNHGNIIQIDTPERLYSAPCDRFTAEFLGSINIFRLNNPRRQHGSIIGEFSGQVLSAPAVEGATSSLLSVRPEFLDVREEGPAPDEDGVRAVLRARVYQGGSTILKLAAADGSELIATHGAGQASCIEIGKPAWVTWPRMRGRIIPETSLSL
ncbi:ABC transporter ATP-binding protein [Mesorhizobium sp. INR15]|uniref:ABC transporter ATP-binding protein n=1 Tax=Mesorhizobium sp. INR15 TaxID=2654248 RepID=UPI0027E57CB1|nr:ABC transporter ATP-binding protein [Mesorhizobium sp. INR15]